MRDYLSIGPVPPAEQCEQVGDNYNSERAYRECSAYRAQLRRELGPEPPGAHLAIKRFNHEYGEYIEVVCYYDTDNEVAAEYAYKAEGSGSEYWDDQSKRELGLGFYRA